MYNAIILAGGESSKQLGDLCSQRYEAMIEIDGRPMVTFVAEALAQSSKVDQILILGPVHHLTGCNFPARVSLAEGGKTLIETIKLGMSVFKDERKVLVATSDIPLLTADAVNDFIAQCEKIDADVHYPIVSKDVNERRYPGNKRTYVRLKEGTFTGGNLFLVNPAIVPQCLKIAEQIIAKRKNPFELAYLLGISFVVKYLFRLLSLEDVVGRVEHLMGIKAAVIQSGYPELGIDVDKPSDLDLVRTTYLQCNKMMVRS